MQIQYVQAKWQTVAHRESVTQIVIHTMENPLACGRALAVAQMFAQGERQASSHYCVDPAAIVQCVRETDVAWHCPGANRRGIGIEHAGHSVGTDWTTPEALAELQLSANLAAQICARWNIPIIKLSPADVTAGKSGFLGHVDATVAFSTPGGHTDPGDDWPWNAYLSMVDAAAGSDV